MQNIAKIGNLTLLDVKQFALKICSTEKTVYTRICRGEFPKEIYIKMGRKPLFIESRVEDWILSGAKFVK